MQKLVILALYLLIWSNSLGFLREVKQEGFIGKPLPHISLPLLLWLVPKPLVGYLLDSVQISLTNVAERMYVLWKFTHSHTLLKYVN